MFLYYVVILPIFVSVSAFVRCIFNMLCCVIAKDA